LLESIRASNKTQTIINAVDLGLKRKKRFSSKTLLESSLLLYSFNYKKLMLPTFSFPKPPNPTLRPVRTTQVVNADTTIIRTTQSIQHPLLSARTAQVVKTGTTIFRTTQSIINYPCTPFHFFFSPFFKTIFSNAIPQTVENGAVIATIFTS